MKSLKNKMIVLGLSSCLLTGAFSGISASAASSIKINKKNFPDKNFRDFVLTEIDINKDKKLSKKEIKKTKEINVNIYRDEDKYSDDESESTADVYDPIKDLKGIEYFTYLEQLDCGENDLKTLDVSSNKKLKSLICYSNYLESIDVSKNTELVTLNCASNSLTKLDVRKNKKLKTLTCYGNKLTSINLKKNKLLESLSCENNLLKSINLKKNKKLNMVYCDNNELESVTIGTLKKLEELHMSGNNLKTVNLSGCAKLSFLDLDNNLLESVLLPEFLDIEGVHLNCNKLSELELNGKVKNIECTDNELTELNVSGCKELYNIDCSRNKLTDLDIVNQTELGTLNCENNQLTSLDISNNPNLTSVECNNNSIEVLVAGSGELFSLDCRDNKITSLDLRGYDGLGSLAIKGNNITDIKFAPGFNVNLSDFDDKEFGLYIDQNTKEVKDAISYVYLDYKGATYEIDTDGTAMIQSINNRKVLSFSIPDTVTYHGRKYRVTTVYSMLASNYRNMHTLKIGKNVKEIGSAAFENCSGLKRVVIKSLNLKKIGINAFIGIGKNVTYEVPKSKLSIYKKRLKRAGASKKAKYVGK